MVGGAANLVSWRLIFFVNLPAGAVALILLARTGRSARRPAAFDWAGQAAQKQLSTDRVRVLGPDHPDTRGTRANLA